MHRIDTPDAAPGGLFTDGNPLVPILATYIDAKWANMVQEEIVFVVMMAGIVLDDMDDTQLYQAIEYLIGAAMVAHVLAANPHTQYVRNDADQGLTAAQQLQARTNINVPSRAFAYFMGQS